MPQTGNVSIWTIGHSNRSIETFLELLKEHNIEVLVDVRSFPTSKVEHFKREEMGRWLPQNGVEYVWLSAHENQTFQGRNQEIARNSCTKENLHHVYGAKPEILPPTFHLGSLGEKKCAGYTYNSQGTDESR